MVVTTGKGFMPSRSQTGMLITHNTKHICGTAILSEQNLWELIKKAVGWMEDNIMHAGPIEAARPPSCRHETIEQRLHNIRFHIMRKRKKQTTHPLQDKIGELVVDIKGIVSLPPDRIVGPEVGIVVVISNQITLLYNWWK